MPSYSYRAHDRSSNKEVKGTIDAGNQQEAIARLKREGKLPIEVKEARARKSGRGAVVGGGGGGSRVGRVKSRQVTEMTRQLSTLQDAGLPIVQSLQIITDMQPPGGFRTALSRITEDVQSGTQLSEAMARFPKIFDKLYTNLVKAGEAAGALEVILRRLAEFREKAQRLKKTVIGALVYPIAVLTIATGILTFIMIYIVPKFKKIFEELGIQLPAMTEFLILISDLVANWWWMGIGGIILFVFGAKMFRNTETGGAIVDRAILRVPVLGGVVKKSSVARFTRTLGTLVTSGVGFLDALEITKEATPNIVVRNAIGEVRESVKEGETINEPLARCGVFNDIVINMIKVGEETGELDKMLIKIADNYDEEVDQSVQAMMALLEPLLIVFMGGAVGFIVIALFLPLIEIINKLGA